GPLVRFAQDDTAATMTAVGAHPTAAVVNGAQMTYLAVYPGVDARYTVDGERIKEDLIFQNPAAVTALRDAAGSPVVTFELSLQGVTAVQRGNGRIAFLDAGQHPRFMIPRPFLVDSGQGGPHGSVQVTLTDLGAGRVRLELRPDAAWLSDQARVYP